MSSDTTPATRGSGPDASGGADPLPGGVDLALVREGDRLAGRYRVLHRLTGPDDALAGVWRAHDEVLARPVAVTLLAAGELDDAVLAAAARASRAQARSLTRVYDAAVEQRPQRPDLTYVIGEWADGEPLAELLARGPLPAAEALALARQATEAVVALHDAGAVHGRLHPGNILVAADGQLRVTDAEVAVVLHPGTVASEQGDVRDLGALLHAMLTARWPAHATGQPGRGVRPAPPRNGDAVSPRQLRAGVPPVLDRIVAQVLRPPGTARRQGQPPLDTATALSAALGQAALTVLPAPARPAARRGRQRWRRLAPWALVAVLLGVLGTVSYSLGLSVGEVAPQGDGSQAPPTGASSAAGAPGGAVDLAAAVVRDYDPMGSPPRENPDQVVNAFDGAPSTAWTTDLYRSERFGGLKAGVGLLVDLGAPTALSVVDVDLTRTGTGLELRAGDNLGADQAALPVVARDDGAAGVAHLTVPPGTTARYWLVWITRLPRDAGQYRAGIDELRLLRR